MPDGVRLWTLRFGFYIERERHRKEGELWTVDPLDPKSEVRPVPLPPPTPPPPLPPTEDETEAWPHRGEDA
jgi:hypothetical protein